MAPRGVFKPRDVELPTPGAVRETLRGLIKRFTQRLAYRGAQAQASRAVTPAIVMKRLAMAREGDTFIKKPCLEPIQLDMLHRHRLDGDQPERGIAQGKG